MKIVHTNFSVQFHHSKTAGKHWDFRIYNPTTRKVMSWALPKQRFPEEDEKIRAMWVDDTHSVNYMTFERDSKYGAQVELIDHGDVEMGVIKDTIYLFLRGKKIKGFYLMVNIHKSKTWLIMKGSPSIKSLDYI